ncbi:mitochondrial ornithine carrier protein, partial [Coemansia sp. RSA 2603]
AGIKFNGPLSVVGHLLRTGGVRALYRGISPTVARETLGVGFWFGTYEMVCRLLMRNGARSKDALGPGSIILAGGCAGIAYNATSYPIDVVKSMIQTEGVRAKGKAQMGVVATAMQVYKTGGVPAFYRGLGITLMRAFPANAAMFMTYEYLSRLLTR